MTRHATKYVTRVTVRDPDDASMVVDLEIRKDVVTGEMVGLDAAWLDRLDGDPANPADNPRSPYHPAMVLMIPDDEPAVASAVTDTEDPPRLDVKGRPVPDSALCCPFELDPDYRLVDGAPNNWLGMIETVVGDPVLELDRWAARDFAAAFAFAQHVVRTFNNEVLGIDLGGCSAPH